MKRLDRYIVLAVARAALLVLLLLLSLALAVEWIDQHSSRVTTAEALHFAVLTLPRRTGELLPFVSLFAALLGLGGLAATEELTAARAAGVPVRRLIGVSLVPVLVLLLLGAWLSEWVIPHAESLVDVERAQRDARRGETPLRWLRVGDRFLAVRAFDAQGVMYGVTGFEFRDLQLQALWRAATVRHVPGELRQTDLRVTRFDGARVAAAHEADGTTALARNLPLEADDFRVRTARDAERMPLSALHRMLQRVRAAQPDALARDASVDVARRFEVVFWRRAASPFALLLLTIIGAAFVFGSARTSSIGTRIVAGVLMGLLFKYVSDLVAPLVVLYAWPPWLSAVVPLCVLSALAVYALRRAH